VEQGLSDHKPIILKINKFHDIRKLKSFIINKKTAKEITLFALKHSRTIKDFLENHRKSWAVAANKWIEIKPNQAYKLELKDMFEKNEFCNDLVKLAMDDKWKNLWADIEKLKFSERQKQAFQKIRKILKYNGFEKRDVSIINKVLFNEKIITNQKEVNAHLKIELCGSEENCTFQKKFDFPKLPPLPLSQLKTLVENLSKNKAVCNDFIDNSYLFESILSEETRFSLF
jgi:hypothetical protein